MNEASGFRLPASGARASTRWVLIALLASAGALAQVAPVAPAAPVAPGPAPAAGAAGLKLRELQERARKADPRALQAYAQLEGARGKQTEVKWAWFPEFQTTLGIGGPTPEARLAQGDLGQLEDVTDGTRHGWGQLGFSTRAEVTATLPIWTFGKLSSGNAAAAHGVLAREALLRRAGDQAAYDMARAYWGWQTSHGGLTSIGSVRGRVDDARKKVQELIAEESDQVTRADAVKLDYVAEEIEARYAETVKNEALALTGMKLLLGLAPEDPIEIAREDLPPPPAQPAADEMIRRARESRPELRAAQEQVAARGALVEVERARLYPDLAIVGGANISYTSNASSPNTPFAYNPYNSRGAYVALGLRGTLDFPQKFARIEQAEAELHDAQAQLRGAESLLRLELQQALGDLFEARTKAERFGREAVIGKQLLVQAGIAFDSGLGDARELFLDTLLYSRAEGERLGALYAAQLAWAALERAVGGRVEAPPAPPPLPAPAEPLPGKR